MPSFLRISFPISPPCKLAILVSPGGVGRLSGLGRTRAGARLWLLGPRPARTHFSPGWQGPSHVRRAVFEFIGQFLSLTVGWSLTSVEVVLLYIDMQPCM